VSLERKDTPYTFMNKSFLITDFATLFTTLQGTYRKIEGDIKKGGALSRTSNETGMGYFPYPFLIF
jgi:hypothetical protein